MGINTNIISNASEAPPKVSEWKRFRRVLFGRSVVLFGLVVIVLFILIAIFAPFIAPFNPNDIDLSQALQQPNRTHLLGTDSLGRDTFSRVVFGTRTSLEIGLIVVGVAAVVGMFLGLLAGYFGGWTHLIIMRIIDALMSFPMILLALTIAALLGSGTRNVIIALAVAMVPAYARLMCAQVLTVKQNDYVVACHSMGASNSWIMFHHIIHNCLPPLIVLITMMLGTVVLSEASLSFLGIGITPPTPAWGSMIQDGRVYLLTHPILSFAPGIILMLVVFAYNMVGDGLRDALDPRLRGTL